MSPFAFALNAWNFGSDLPIGEQLARTSAAGFGGIELTIDETGAGLTFDTPMSACQDVAAHAAELKLPIVGLACGAFWRKHYASADPAARRQAIDWTLRALDAAAALGVDSLLVIPAIVGRFDQPRNEVAYEDAWARSREALLSLRFEAESRGVVIALENVWNRFCYSPLEWRDFMNGLASRWVATCFDVGNVCMIGDPVDWIATLGRLIHRVHVKDYRLSTPGRAGFVPLGEGEIPWPAVLAALRDARYTGPLIYEGRGDPAEILQRMHRVLTTP